MRKISILNNYFIGLLIMYVMGGLHFDTILNTTELLSWNSLINMIKNLLYITYTRESKNSSESVSLIIIIDSFKKLAEK